MVGGVVAERGRWGGVVCLRASGVSLVERGTLLCCLLAKGGPRRRGGREVRGGILWLFGGVVAERGRWGGVVCLRACGVSLVERGTLLCCLLAMGGPRRGGGLGVRGATPKMINGV